MKEQIKTKCAWPLIYKHRLYIPLKSYLKLKNWQNQLDTKVLIVKIKKKKEKKNSVQCEITWLQLLTKWIRVLSCNSQEEHKGERDFPKRNSILLRFNRLLSICIGKL